MLKSLAALMSYFYIENIKSFKNNCAYCGKEIDRHNDNKPAGQVDHFIPKSLSPKLVYVWDNYLWSCSVCNFKKREAIGLLNPCNENEMKYLDFDGATGMYILKKIYKNDLKIKKKYEMTMNKTLFNTRIVKDEKKIAYTELNDCIEKLNTLPNMIVQAQTTDVQNYFTKEFKKAFEILRKNLSNKKTSHIFMRKRIIRNICKKEKIKITELFFSSKRIFITL